MAKIKPGNFCPLIKKECIGIKCAWYTQMRGVNPNTGEPIDEWGCAVSWIYTSHLSIPSTFNSNTFLFN